MMEPEWFEPPPEGFDDGDDFGLLEDDMIEDSDLLGP
jgi:hypothetical protein